MDEIHAKSKASAVAEQKEKGQQIRNSVVCANSDETRQKCCMVGNIIVKEKMEM